MSKLGLELGKWLFKARPGLLSGNEDDTTEALNAVAAALGGLLATILLRSGEEAYEKSIRILFANADDAARRTVHSTLLKKASTAPKGLS